MTTTSRRITFFSMMVSKSGVGLVPTIPVIRSHYRLCALVNIAVAVLMVDVFGAVVRQGVDNDATKVHDVLFPNL
jgi:hypothetical protein